LTTTTTTTEPNDDGTLTTEGGRDTEEQSTRYYSIIHPPSLERFTELVLSYLSLNYSETLEQLLAIRKLKRATAGLDLERLNAGEKKKRTRINIEESTTDGATAKLENGMIEGLNGGLNNSNRDRDRLRDDE